MAVPLSAIGQVASQVATFSRHVGEYLVTAQFAVRNSLLDHLGARIGKCMHGFIVGTAPGSEQIVVLGRRAGTVEPARRARQY